MSLQAAVAATTTAALRAGLPDAGGRGVTAAWLAGSKIPPGEQRAAAFTAAAADLGPGEYLRVLHRREPLPLFPLLEKLGCAWRCRPGNTTPYEVLVWRAADPVAAAAAVEA